MAPVAVRAARLWIAGGQQLRLIAKKQIRNDVMRTYANARNEVARFKPGEKQPVYRLKTHGLWMAGGLAETILRRLGASLAGSANEPATFPRPPRREMGDLGRAQDEKSGVDARGIVADAHERETFGGGGRDLFPPWRRLSWVADVWLGEMASNRVGLSIHNRFTGSANLPASWRAWAAALHMVRTTARDGRSQWPDNWWRMRTELVLRRSIHEKIDFEVPPAGRRRLNDA